MTSTASQSTLQQYEPVDIAFVVESTYPYLRGGLSAVVHDIVLANPDKKIGIIHITWDRNSLHEDAYGIPPNVLWVFPVYLSMDEHSDDFRALGPSALRTSTHGRQTLVKLFFNALQTAMDCREYSQLWRLYDEGVNPRTRNYNLWALMSTREFLIESRERLSDLDISLTNLFWLLREFFSLACAVLGPDYPYANIYHSHTTGYAGLASAA